MTAKLRDITGHRFGRLVAQTFLGKEHAFKWSCLCDCGKQHATTGFKLRSGAVKSCGCLDRERIIERNTTHGLSKTPEYKVYTGMIRRCRGEGENSHYYVERGIQVCQRWLGSFEAFMADMGPRPSPKHSINRIDNDGNYEPENCRWATKKEQARNKSSNRIVTFQGREMPLVQATELAGIPYEVVSDRINRLGWTVEAALARKEIGRWA